MIPLISTQLVFSLASFRNEYRSYVSTDSALEDFGGLLGPSDGVNEYKNIGHWIPKRRQSIKLIKGDDIFDI